MKKLFALLLVTVMVLVGTTACGENNVTDNAGSNVQGSSSVNKDPAENKGTTSTFTLGGVTFNVPGEFKEKAAKENVLAISCEDFVVSINYHGETSYTNQEEILRSEASSVQKTYPDSTVDVVKNESTGMFYYTIKGSDRDTATCVYIVDGVSLSFITSSFSEQALNTISSIEFAK